MEVHLYETLLLISMPISLAVGLYVFAATRRTVGWLFLGLCLSIVAWGLFRYLQIRAEDRAHQYLFILLQHPGVDFVPVMFLALTRELARREGRRGLSFLVAISAFPVVDLLMIFLNDYHHLFYLGDGLAAPGIWVNPPRGPWWWIHTVYLYALLVAAFVILGKAIARIAGRLRTILVVFTVSLAVNALVNVAFILLMIPVPELAAIDVAPILFALNATVIALVITRFNFLDPLPFAKDLVYNAISDPILVAEEEGSIVSANRSAEALFGRAPAGKGRRLEDLLPPASDGRAEGEIDLQGRRFVVRLDLLEERPGKKAGTLAILHDVTEQRRMMEELRSAKERAEAAARAKSEFLANMSHEIRTPLNAITGFAELLGRRAGEGPERRLVEGIKAGGASLLRIIDDILDLSKLEAGRLEIREERVDLRALASEVLEIFEPGARAKGLELSLEAAADLPPTLLLDGTRLRQILFNLIGNAIKFTEKGRVTLRLGGLPTADGSHDLSIAVADTGIGISEADRELVFEAFRQAESRDSRAYGGTGLGLTITRRLTGLMGGDVTLDSEPGRGSTFTVRLGARKRGRSGGGREAPPEDLPAAPDFGGARVLLIEDNDSNRELLDLILSDWGLVVKTASSGEEGHALARTFLPALVLLDLQMPRLDGFQTLARFREDPLLADLPVVAVSASVLGSDRERVDAAFQGFLSKPYSQAKLHALLRRFLGPGGIGIAQPVITAGAPASESPHVSPPSRGSGSRDGTGKGLILVVDDQAANLELMEEMLREEGFQVLTAAGGEEALALASARLPDLVLLDLRMPGMDGYEVCRRLKAGEATAALPVIFVTAGGEGEELVRAFGVGGADFVTKPYRRFELLARVRTQLEVARSRLEAATLSKERERSRIALDLHDTMAQELAAAKLHAQILASGDPAGAAPLLEAIRRAIADLRQIIWDLNPPTLERQGLKEAVEEYARAFADRNGVAISTRFEGFADLRLSTELSVNLFRVFQEALTNAIRHGAPDSISVALKAGGGRIRLEVGDDGRGFEPSAAAAPGPDGSHRGLVGMRERARLVRGRLDLESSPGGGTRIVLEAPLGR